MKKQIKTVMNCMEKCLLCGMILLAAGCDLSEIAANLDYSTDNQSTGGETATDSENSTDTLSDEGQPGEHNTVVSLNFCGDFNVRYTNQRLEDSYVNSDGLGFTTKNETAVLIQPFHSEDETFGFSGRDIEYMSPLVTDMTSGIVYGTSPLSVAGEDSHTLENIFSIVAVGPIEGVKLNNLMWFVPLEDRFDFSDISSAQRVAMMLHPVDGIVVVGMLNELLVLGAGESNETMLENTADHAVTFMAHFLDDGSLMSARVLETDIVPSRILSVSENGQDVMILAGQNYNVNCTPAALAKFDLSGNKIWETSNECDSQYSGIDDMEANPPIVFDGPDNSFYMVQGVYAGAVFKGTQANTIVIPRMAFTNTYFDEEAGAEATEYDAYSLVVARYNMSGELLTAKRLDESLNVRTDANTNGVAYNGIGLLMGATLNENATFDASKPIPFDVPPAGQYFIGVFDPITLNAIGTAPLEVNYDGNVALLPTEYSENSVAILGVERNEEQGDSVRIKDLCGIIVIE
ncbi:MAG: hypothetical protein JXR76_23480 [Deltaproteobacteria bacterium]|nr:hypothetical protein [Deltaproteobacteria bacterium]